MPLGKYQKAKGSNSVKYGEKTSEHGHYAPKHSYAGTNSDGSSWQSHQMEWVEDKRNFSQPKQQKSQPAPTPPPQPEPKNDLVVQPTRPDETRGRGHERKNPHVPRNPDLSKYPAPKKEGPMDIFLNPVDPNRDYGDPFSPAPGNQNGGKTKGPDKDFIPTPENQSGGRKKGPGYVNDHGMPSDPNRDYGESPFSKHTSNNDYTFTPQAQEAKERALSFKNNFDRS
jgi:hypothetical protein